jgi:ketosteroid isomerase-like protein
VTRTFAKALLPPAFLTVLLVAGGCVSYAPHSKAGPISDEERARIKAEILELEDQLDEAYESNDLDRYWSFYADDLTQLWDSGRVTLEQYKKDWTALVEGGGGVVESRSEDVHVRVSPLGDSAVVTYPLFARYRGADGTESAALYYETDVWFRQDGGWKMVHYHFSTAAEPEDE